MASEVERAASFPASPTRVPPMLASPSTPPRGGYRLPIVSDSAGLTSSAKQSAPPVFSKFLMNDIPRGTSRVKLARFLLAQSSSPIGPLQQQLQVVFGSAISDSRLDDELSVATLEFSDTPAWLLSQDPSGFPKFTTLGTIWRGVDRHATDENGQSEFIRAVLNSQSRLGLQYAEMLAEFADTDVNIQDDLGRTALHWACVESLPDMVRLCLSVPDFATGLRDHDGFTAFDIALRTGNEVLPSLFYSSMFELEQSSPQVALLRVLTLSSDKTASVNQPLFPGEALFQPVGERNSPLVVALLDRGVVLTTKNEDGNTALHIAAGQVGNVDMVTRLVKAGSDINAIGNRGATPLHTAVRTADAEMVQLLLQWDADVAITDEDKMSTLHLAAESGKLDITRVLVHGGADVAARDSLGRSVVDVAKANRNLEIVEFLIARDKLPDHVVTDPSDSPQDVPVPELWQSETQPRNPDVSKNLLEAAQKGDLDAVRSLLSQGADIAAVDKDSHTALHRAAEGGHTEIVKSLLAHGANTEAAAEFGITALHSAIVYGKVHTVEALLAGGAKTEAYTTGQTSYHYSHIDFAKYSISGAGHRALHLAATHNQPEIAEILLAAGAQIEAKASNDSTALHLAALNGRIATVHILIGAGATLEMKDWWGDRPLHNAVEMGHTEIVQILLSAGAEVAARNDVGDTPYQQALRSKHKDIVTILGSQTSATERLRSRLRPRAWIGN